MSKVPTRRIDQVLRELASSSLTETELKVFLDWFQDAPDYHSSSTLTARRTGLDPSAVKRARKSLREKGVLIESGQERLPTGQIVKTHSLGKIPLRSGASLSPPQVNNNPTVGDKESLEGVTNSPPIHSNKHSKTNIDRFDGFPGAKQIYDTLTESSYGSMSKEEYAKQRSYAESFPKVDLDKIRKRMAEIENLDKEL